MDGEGGGRRGAGERGKPCFSFTLHWAVPGVIMCVLGTYVEVEYPHCS